MTALLLVACERSAAPPTKIMASSYDRACKLANDCVPVPEGDTHDCSSDILCPNAAISAYDRERYSRNFSTLLAQCGVIPPTSCSGGLITCPAGQCEFHSSDSDGGGLPVLSSDDYTHSCTDCLAVYVGPIGCCGIGCPNAAINVSAQPQYMTDLASRTPNCFPGSACISTGPCTNGRIACENGTCVLHGFGPDGGDD
jgi:hypothetical protein